MTMTDESGETGAGTVGRLWGMPDSELPEHIAVEIDRILARAARRLLRERLERERQALPDRVDALLPRQRRRNSDRRERHA